MMGEEPLEVAREHQYSLYPERFFHDSSTVSTDPVGTQVSRDRLPNAYGSTAQVSASSNKQSAASTAPRRVRHRVDAGEPRGCFSNNTPSTWSPRLPFGNRFHPHFLPPPPPHAPHFVYARTPPPQYFGSASIQPMKMLSEFISSVTPSGSSRDNQLLLREMLCKNAQNNNEYEGQSNSNKSKLDGMVSIMMEKLSNTPEPEVIPNEQGRENEEQSAEANAMGDETEPTNKAAADLLNNNTQGQKNKRKKYQPQRSDLLDIPDEIENQDDEIVEDQGEELKTLKRKLDEYSDLDEDEALMLRIQSSRSSAATTNPDDLECEFENEEDEQEAMINDDLNHDKEREQEVGSRRTLPVVRNLMKERKHEAAPLTRSLLTTRIASSSTPPPPPPPSQQQQQQQQHHRNITSPLNKQTPPHMDLCSPPPFLNQWKENLKSTLITHINELVEAQFSLLLGGNLIPQALASSTLPPQRPQSNDPHRLRESNMKQEQKSTPPPSTPTPVKPLHLNGGSVLNTDKICVQNHEVKKLPVSRMSDNKPQQQDYPPRPFPFMHDNMNRKIPPPFSTALVGLSNAHNTVQGIENMFDNDGALSLVVGKHADAVTPRKKRHKVTDTRLTPRAVSRLLNQDATSSSPCYDPQTSPNASPNHGGIEPRSILQNGTPPPRDRVTPQTNNQDIPRNFNPFVPPQNPQFFHPGLPHPLSHHLAQLESPPMGNSLLHPALQNPSEYVERLREMSHGQEQRARDSVVVRERTEHHHAGIREYPSVRGLRDRGTGGSMMLSNDVLELIGRSGSAGGSDSDRESGSQFEMSSGGGMYCHTTSTLTPMHLRKAKLMFFWTRYPSSAVIKMYFPDIKFNKNNTAQLVKWFSNFREFYYIQMEKYARQALSEGVKQADDLVVTNDSELYRVLNLHYNRNNHIEVPTNFRFVVEQTLREFFKSIQAGKDAEQSWKKAIYKIIARLDDPVPEYFKSPNFLEQLE